MKILNSIDGIFFQISKLSLFVGVLLTTANAAGRFFFNTPILGAYEFTEDYLMIIMVFLSISYTWKERGHIAVDVISDNFPIKIRNFIYLGVLVLGMLFFGIIGYLGLMNTIEAWMNQYAPVGLVSMPNYTSVIWVPIGCFIMVIRMLFELVIGLNNIKKIGAGSELFEEVDAS